MIENIDLSKSKEYSLSIRLGSDGFSFSIVNPKRNDSFKFSQFEINSSCSISANLKRWLSSTEELNLDYKEVNVIFDSSRFMAVPSELFQEEKMEELFFFSYSRLNNEKILSNLLAKDNIYVVFGVDKYSYQIMREHYANALFYCSQTPLASYYADKSRMGDNKKLFIHLREHDIKMFCFDKNKLLLMNSYSCRKLSDRIYYILYVWNQIGYDIDKDEIILNGDIKDKDKLIKELKRFIPNVYKLLPKAEFNRSPLAQMENMPFEMQTLLLCE